MPSRVIDGEASDDYSAAKGAIRAQTKNYTELTWHMCLKAISPRVPLPPFEALKAGWDAHSRIESMFPELEKEQPQTFRDPSLPFLITYRPDQYDPVSQTVYDIKNLRWAIRHLSYCVAQLSGYVHFQQAKHGVFLLYKFSRIEDGKKELEGPWPWTPPFLYDWGHLHKVAMESYKLLTEGGH